MSRPFLISKVLNVFIQETKSIFLSTLEKEEITFQEK